MKSKNLLIVLLSLICNNLFATDTDSCLIRKIVNSDDLDFYICIPVIYNVQKQILIEPMLHRCRWCSPYGKVYANQVRSDGSIFKPDLNADKENPTIKKLQDEIN